jgi:hypothetical protein
VVLTHQTVVAAIVSALVSSAVSIVLTPHLAEAQSAQYRAQSFLLTSDGRTIGQIATHPSGSGIMLAGASGLSSGPGLHANSDETGSSLILFHPTLPSSSVHLRSYSEGGFLVLSDPANGGASISMSFQGGDPRIVFRGGDGSVIWSTPWPLRE